MSTASDLKAMVERARATTQKYKQNASMLMREGVSTAEIAATGFAVGFANERFGSVDAETGLKLHKTNGVPTALLAGAVLKVGSALDMFGDYSRDGFAVGSGAIAGWANDAGRAAAIRMARKDEKAPEVKAAANA
jgi:hypothetical protein